MDCVIVVNMVVVMPRVVGDLRDSGVFESKKSVVFVWYGQPWVPHRSQHEWI